MKTLDDQIREAFTALDESVPEGYHETFPSRIDQMLEVQAMAPDTPEKSGDKARGEATSSEVSKDAKAGPTENTGLHDIKAMARTTKERISRRVTTQSDVEESLLVSSSTGLKAVVLPEPGKDKPKYDTETEATHAREAEEEAHRGLPLWLYGAVGVVAVAAVVFFVIRGRGGEEEEKVAALEPASAEAADTDGVDTETPGTEEPVVARLDPSAIQDDEGGDEAEASADDSDTPEPSVTPISPETAGGAAASPTETAAAPEKPAATSDNKSDKHHRSTHSRERDHAKKETADKKPAAKTEPKPADAPPPKEKSSSEPRSLEDILDNEMGPVAEPSKAGGTKAAAKKKVPTKTELSGTDIRKGMRSVLARVQACYTQYKKSGTVKVSVTVSNDGSVAEAFAVGGFKGSPTGTCVATAVKSAKFPAWDGRPKSFKYSYLLAD